MENALNIRMLPAVCPPTPSGQACAKTDKEMLNSRGEWERQPRREEVLLRDIRVAARPPREGETAELEPLLARRFVGRFRPWSAEHHRSYCHAGHLRPCFTVAERNEKGKLIIQRWVRRALPRQSHDAILVEQKFGPQLQKRWLRGVRPFCITVMNAAKLLRGLASKNKPAACRSTGTVWLFKPVQRSTCHGLRAAGGEHCRKLPRAHGVVHHGGGLV